ncbi:MAG: FAD-dependent oxidoreductase, partial [Ilumatobacteraceae bacterium]
VGFDRRTATGTAGGYVGDGGATAHLAGRTLALLVLDQHDDDLVRLPWVGHRSRNWEPEPLRWLGVNAGRVAAARSDAAERNRGTESRFWTSVMRFLLRR